MEGEKVKGAYLSARKRADMAEAKIRALADEAQKQVAKLGAHATLFESAVTVMLKHGLLSEWAAEVSRTERIAKVTERGPPEVTEPELNPGAP